MGFLGGFLVGQELAFSVTWTLAPGEGPITASELRLTHPDGDVLILPGVLVGSTWSAQIALPKSGSWEVEWRTTPPGGVTEDRIYVG